jgi:hypothetical protein
MPTSGTATCRTRRCTIDSMLACDTSAVRACGRTAVTAMWTDDLNQARTRPLLPSRSGPAEVIIVRVWSVSWCHMAQVGPHGGGAGRRAFSR